MELQRTQEIYDSEDGQNHFDDIDIFNFTWSGDIFVSTDIIEATMEVSIIDGDLECILSIQDYVFGVEGFEPVVYLSPVDNYFTQCLAVINKYISKDIIINLAWEERENE